MTSIFAHTHTRHWSVFWQHQESDECIKSVRSQASSQIHVKLRAADNSWLVLGQTVVYLCLWTLGLICRDVS